ncbi:MAG: hypothetical protein M3N34_00285 [Pseudomonadota bacterium]|nr:hypothetical protein [Pseudomonadota bacterium]
MQDDPQKLPPAVADSSQPVIPDHEGGATGPAAQPSPAWAKDLRELYNAVVEEPLPDSFTALLSQLDAED